MPVRLELALVAVLLAGCSEPHYWTVRVAAVRGNQASLDAREE